MSESTSAVESAASEASASMAQLRDPARPLSVKELFEAGVHFGHQTRRWNPKMRPYLYGSRNGTHIIDLDQTVQLFRRAFNFVADVVARGGHVMFVGTKRQAQDIVREEAAARGLPPEREHLIRVGTLLRQQHGPGVLAERLAPRLGGRDVVDSIRNPAEVARLKDVPGFLLVGVSAPTEVRFARSRRRSRPGDPTTLEEFTAREEQENTANPAGQQLRATFALADRGVGSLILTSTQGGMLANAVYLPQGGQPTRIINTKARVRGAVALAHGASASIQVGGRPVLGSATAGVIGSRYTLLDAGSVPVTLTVNGTVVPVANLDLAAGADYTLLVWSNASGPQASLVVDDNRLPSGGVSMTKLRLLNGMSTLAAPLTLAIDFSPVIEGTLTGQVSDEIEVSAGTDRQFDLSNTSTAQGVLTRSSITLQGNSVYTFFMTDNGATPIGVLRRDR